MFTGQYPWRKEGTGIAAGNAAMIIKPKQHTMPRMLQSMGYKTGALGKWHLGLGAETGYWQKPDSQDKRLLILIKFHFYLLLYELSILYRNLSTFLFHFQTLFEMVDLQDS
ncbi:MAG: hypothetical protein AUK44_02690 [Porphyromonadaceae bacterium CG2_30_38_12]|nr:MAG: hypothetical protein AUK44_02690 [Porphyromonadaceae bacterium CG2_30_38_12]